MWASIPFHVGQHYGDVGRCLVMRGSWGLPRWFGDQVLIGFPCCHCCSIRTIFDRSGSQ
jgi:hypothetical protein